MQLPIRCAMKPQYKQTKCWSRNHILGFYPCSLFIVSAPFFFRCNQNGNLNALKKKRGSKSQVPQRFPNPDRCSPLPGFKAVAVKSHFEFAVLKRSLFRFYIRCSIFRFAYLASPRLQPGVLNKFL